MNLLHGDHAAKLIREECVVAAVCVSHDIGIPCTTLMKGQTCDPYCLHMIEFLGTNVSAE